MLVSSNLQDLLRAQGDNPSMHLVPGSNLHQHPVPALLWHYTGHHARRQLLPLLSGLLEAPCALLQMQRQGHGRVDPLRLARYWFLLVARPIRDSKPLPVHAIKRLDFLPFGVTLPAIAR
jgi:hypothetical protein